MLVNCNHLDTIGSGQGKRAVEYSRRGKSSL